MELHLIWPYFPTLIYFIRVRHSLGVALTLVVMVLFHHPCFSFSLRVYVNHYGEISTARLHVC